MCVPIDGERLKLTCVGVSIVGWAKEETARTTLEWFEHHGRD